jgi:hypothetical protein
MIFWLGCFLYKLKTGFALLINLSAFVEHHCMLVSPFSFSHFEMFFNEQTQRMFIIPTKKIKPTPQIVTQLNVADDCSKNSVTLCRVG